MTSTAAELLREARLGAGLTQSALARRSRVAQSVISAYERGRREPSLPTLQRLVAAAGRRLSIELDAPPAGASLAAVRSHADELRAALTPLGAQGIRVFGSVARGDDRSDSDVDLLVDLAPETGLFALLRMQSAAEAILGRPVDLVPADAIKPDVSERALAEAVAL